MSLVQLVPLFVRGRSLKVLQFTELTHSHFDDGCQQLGSSNTITCSSQLRAQNLFFVWFFIGSYRGKLNFIGQINGSYPFSLTNTNRGFTPAFYSHLHGSSTIESNHLNSKRDPTCLQRYRDPKGPPSNSWRRV